MPDILDFDVSVREYEMVMNNYEEGIHEAKYEASEYAGGVSRDHEGNKLVSLDLQDVDNVKELGCGLQMRVQITFERVIEIEINDQEEKPRIFPCSKCGQMWVDEDDKGCWHCEGIPDKGGKI